jgi:hypothetical protein
VAQFLLPRFQPFLERFKFFLIHKFTFNPKKLAKLVGRPIRGVRGPQAKRK